MVTSVTSASPSRSIEDAFDVMKKRQRDIDAEHMRPPLKHGRNISSANEQTESKLGELLSVEYFLLKVLHYLVDDGLEECRRVCRFWRDTAKNVSVELTLRSHAALQASKAVFPNASAITCTREIFSADVLAKTDIKSSFYTLGYGLNSEIFDQVRYFPKLQKLSLRGWDVDHVVLDSAFAELTRLTSLDIAVSSPEYTYAQCLLCLRHLVNLKALELGLINSDTTGAEALPELKKIESLAIHGDLLAKQDGTPFFPSLTLLTHLSIRTLHSQHHRRFPNGILPVIGHYKASVKRLEMRPPFADEFSTEELTHLPQFTRLETIVINGLCLNSDAFWSALSKTKSLTQLDVLSVDLRQRSVVDSIFSLSAMRSLTFGDVLNGGDAKTLPSFSQLRQLTKLHVLGIDLGDLSCLPNLIDLRIWDRPKGSHMDVCATLESVPQLQRLRLVGKTLYVSSSLLRTLTELNILSLEGVAVEDDLFEALISLANLRTLHINFQEEMIHLYPQVNRLTALENLTIWGNCHAPYTFLREAKLIRLRYLKVERDMLTREEALDLRQKLPCLRKITARTW